MHKMESFWIQASRLQSLIKIINLTRSTNVTSVRHYSVYPPTYVQPIFRKNEQALLKESGKVEIVAHSPIRPALATQTCSEFYDPVIKKFTNYIQRQGKKALARSLLEGAFENIKRTQLERYHQAKPANKHEILLNPTEILYKAIENSTPVMELIRMKKGGSSYQVPVPLLEKRQKFLAMNWLIKAAQDKEGEVPFTTTLAKELIDAAHNQGRVVKKKQELHKQCEANRAYAHYRWT